MPINQSRLITQNKAALLSLQALQHIRSHIASLNSDIAQGLSIAQAYGDLINFIADDNILFPPEQAHQLFSPELPNIGSTFNRIFHVVIEEYNHFNRNAKRNEYAAQYQRARRDSESKGNPYRKKRISQPHTIFESSTLPTPLNQPNPITSKSYENPDPNSTTYSAKNTPEQTDEEAKEIAAEIARMTASKSDPNPSYDPQTPSSKPAWNKTPINPEDDNVFDEADDENKLPPAGQNS